MESGNIKLPAFAKINLSLRVGGKRADGYHELDTIFQTVSLHDTLSFATIDRREIEFSCDDRSLPIDDHNLVVRAARKLQHQFAVGAGARIHLLKRIPTRAGLGGGSADAAVTILALSQLWQLHPTPAQLQAVAAELGADVPFFLHGGRARGTGTGDQIEPLPDIAESFLIIVKPNIDSSSADAYKALDKHALTSTEGKTILSRSRSKEFFDNEEFAGLKNDFDQVLAGEPEIERAKAAVKKSGALLVMLAGSGSAVFGIFASEVAQRRAIQAIELETGWRVFPCKTVGREEYRNSLGELRQLFG